MAVKGDRARLYDVAFRRFVDTGNLTQVADELGVSRQTLTEWKADTRKPGEELDEWDRARQQKRATTQRLADLYERELQAAEESAAGSISAATMDALYKLGAMVRKWQEIERAEAAAAQGPAVEIDRPKIFLENVDWLAKQLKDVDPEGLKVLARNFDALVVAFKAEHARQT